MLGAGAVFVPKRLTLAEPSPSLTPFVDPLPVPPVISPPEDGSVIDIRMQPLTRRLHRDLPPTPLWGYNGLYLGPTFDVRAGSRVSVRWINELPTQHLLPVDHTLHGAESSRPEVRTVVHLHGGKVLPDSDGHPEAWFTNGFAEAGPSFSTRVYTYPNDQPATMLWYHDHALGITRLNVFAGLAGVYLIRDDVEDALPLPRGRFEVPLVFQDRSFNVDGSLAYPVRDPGVGPAVPPVWLPEFFGDTALVNGTVMPFLEVEPRKYRFRMLNACNARFLRLTLVDDDGKRLTFRQIGSDQGLLPRAVGTVDLLMGPAERYDVVIDFKGQRGKALTLVNDAPAPFPGGGGPELPQLMQFRVTLPPSERDESLPARLTPAEPMKADDAERTRQLVLSELDDPATGDPIIGLLGTAAAGGLHWSEPVTEDPRAGSTEVWELLNTTMDAHPIHVHLVRFQVLDRQPFDLTLFQATGEIRFLGPPEKPPLNERHAWKDTVKVLPGDPDNGVGSLTRIIPTFELPRGVPIPEGGALPYVWHCHVLEHEDNDMMRPYNVLT